MVKYFKVTTGIVDEVVLAPNPYRFNNGEMIEVEPNVIRIEATEEEIAEWGSVQNCMQVEYLLYESVNYAMLRKSEYPDIAEFADAYVKDDTLGMQAYKAKCLAVKAKYPK